MSNTIPSGKIQAEQELFCSQQEALKDLVTSPLLEGKQFNDIKVLLKDVETNSFSSSFYNPGYLASHRKIPQADVIKTLAITLVDERAINRVSAVLGLTQVRAVPQARRLLEDIAQHYPIEAIRNKASQTLEAPDIPLACLLLLNTDGRFFGNPDDSLDPFR